MVARGLFYGNYDMLEGHKGTTIIVQNKIKRFEKTSHLLRN